MAYLVLYAFKHIPMALGGQDRWRPNVLHPPTIRPVKRACILRVLVGAQAAPVFLCSLVSPDLIIDHRALLETFPCRDTTTLNHGLTC
jgi:hypothetical protein